MKVFLLICILVVGATVLEHILKIENKLKDCELKIDKIMQVLEMKGA